MITKLFLAISIFLSTFTHSFGDESVRIAGEEWPPFSSKQLKHSGVMNRIITESFAIGGVKVDYHFFPGARALVEVKAGRFDATPGWTPNDERAKDYYFSDTLFDETMVFFYLKTKPFEWKTWDDLKGINIGAVYDSYYGKGFEKAEIDGMLTIDNVPLDFQNFKKLLLGRIDIVPKNLNAGLSLLQTEFTPEERSLIRYHPLPLDQGPLVMMFSKKSKSGKRMLTLFNNGLRQLKSEGRYDQYFHESQRGDYNPRIN